MSAAAKKRRKRPGFGGGIRLLIIAALIAAGVLALLISFGVIGPGAFSAYKRPAAADASTSVRFIDVGQGDCTLVVSKGEAMLIDTGETDGQDRVISYIRSLGIERLRYIIITHPHSDHMGEAADIINSFEVGGVIMPVLPKALTPTAYSYERLLKTMEKRGVPLTAAGNEEFPLGEIRVRTYIPDKWGEDLNNCSAVVRLIHGSSSFLITGDCGRDEEAELLRQGCDLRADVLKVGHHGSSSSSSEAFLAAVRPLYAVISCGADNDYGHPSEKTLLRLKAIARETYITRDSGTVTFVSDGRGLTVHTER